MQAMVSLTIVAALLGLILVWDRGLSNVLEQAGLTLIGWARARRIRVGNVQEAVAKRAELLYTVSDEEFSCMMRAAVGKARK
jgi:hypothetical protein